MKRMTFAAAKIKRKIQIQKDKSNNAEIEKVMCKTYNGLSLIFLFKYLTKNR